MCNTDTPLNQIMRGSALGLFPLMARDMAFRSVLLGLYYGTQEIEHKPLLKYSIPQIADFMKARRAMYD